MCAFVTYLFQDRIHYDMLQFFKWKVNFLSLNLSIKNKSKDKPNKIYLFHSFFSSLLRIGGGGGRK